VAADGVFTKSKRSAHPSRWRTGVRTSRLPLHAPVDGCADLLQITMLGFTTGLNQPLRWAKLSDRKRLTLYDLMVGAWHLQGLPDCPIQAAQALRIEPAKVSAVWAVFRIACVPRDGKLLFPEMWAAIDKNKTLAVRGEKAGLASAESRKAQQEQVSQEINSLAEQLVAVSTENATSAEEPTTKKKERHAHKINELQQQLVEVFEYWKTVTEHPTALFTPKRKQKVLLRLKDGYTVAQIKQAINGNKLSPFHQGDNDHATKYDDLELICRDGQHLENFIRNAVQAAERKQGVPNSFGAQFVASAAGYSYEQITREGNRLYNTIKNTGKWIDERHIGLIRIVPNFKLDPALFLQYWNDVLQHTGFPNPETIPRYFGGFIEWQK